MDGPNRGTSKTAGLLLDAAGVERIFRTYRGLVAEVVAWKLSGFSREDVEEVASSVWLHLLADDARRLRSFAGSNGASLSTWLARVAKNAAVDRLRGERTGFVPLEGGAEGERLRDTLRDPSPDPLDRLLAMEARKEILLAVRDLPKIYRRVVVARFYRGLEAAQTAVRHGVAENTVYVRLSRAIDRLRRGLGHRRISR